MGYIYPETWINANPTNDNCIVNMVSEKGIGWIPAVKIKQEFPLTFLFFGCEKSHSPYYI